jgi:MFS superfamily sulfate permease-like transporter
MSKYGIDPDNDLTEAVDFVAEACVWSGALLLILGLLNLGELIRFVSYPVMTGFTTAVAMIIGLSQVKNAFGFGSEVPQVCILNSVNPFDVV